MRFGQLDHRFRKLYLRIPLELPPTNLMAVRSMMGEPASDLVVANEARERSPNRRALVMEVKLPRPAHLDLRRTDALLSKPLTRRPQSTCLDGQPDQSSNRHYASCPFQTANLYLG